MAAPLHFLKLSKHCVKPRYVSPGWQGNCFGGKGYKNVMENFGCRRFYTNQKMFTGNRRSIMTFGTYATASLAIGLYTANITRKLKAHSTEKPKHKFIREIKSQTDSSGLKLTLYQYQTCPFCTKVRTYLDFMGISYNVVEVNSVRRTEMKWSKYKKVPVLLIDGHGEDGFMQLNDSSAIISVLESYLEKNKSTPIDQLANYYPPQDGIDKFGKKCISYPTRYNIMFGEEKADPSQHRKSQKEQKEERKWRQWTDESFVHTLSPNIYRTLGESIDAFRYFDRIGEWETVFNSFDRALIIYVGSIAMYLISKRLKKKHKMEDDVRASLYASCHKWVNAVKKQDRQFMGGDKPNLADLAVYGALNSIEGCQAFEDTVRVTDIKPWYEATKRAVASHVGARPEKNSQ